MQNAEIASSINLTLSPGKPINAKMQVGHHYKVRKPGNVGDPGELQVPDDLIATRQSDTLHLRYADGSTADFEDFYRLCKDASVCSVNVASDSDTGITLSADNAGGGTPTQYAVIGADIGLAASIATNLGLLNDIIGAQSSTGVDSVNEINNLARIANAIELTAAGGTPNPSLTAADFTLIGISGINSGNLQIALAAIGAQADNGSGTDSLAKLQSLVDNTPPPVPVINAISGDNLVNAAEATQGFTISGSGEVGASVALTFGSGVTLTGGNTALIDGSGNWSVHVGAADVSAFGQGAESISAIQTDPWGNPSAQGNTSINIDVTAPTNSVSSVAFSLDFSLAGTLRKR